MTPDQQLLLFTGNFLLERGYRYPEDFNGDTAVALAARHIVNKLELIQPKTDPRTSN